MNEKKKKLYDNSSYSTFPNEIIQWILNHFPWILFGVWYLINKITPAVFRPEI